MVGAGEVRGRRAARMRSARKQPKTRWASHHTYTYTHRLDPVIDFYLNITNLETTSPGSTYSGIKPGSRDPWSGLTVAEAAGESNLVTPNDHMVGAI